MAAAQFDEIEHKSLDQFKVPGLPPSICLSGLLQKKGCITPGDTGETQSNQETFSSATGYLPVRISYQLAHAIS